MQLISVCMATYNGENYIKQQIESILIQLSINDEIIVSDDGSQDQTLPIVQSFNDPRIKIFFNKGEKGPVGNFENALRQASGDFIFLADQDDIWLNTKIGKMVSLLKSYDLVVCDCEIVNDDLKVICSSYFEYVKSDAGFFKNLRRNTYMGNCMAFRRNLLSIALPFPKNIPNHDIWLGVVADLFYKPFFTPEILGKHRRHNNNASNTFDIKIKTSFYQKLNKRIILFSHLPGLFKKHFFNKN